MGLLLLRLLPVAYRPEATWPAETMAISRELLGSARKLLAPFTSRIPSRLPRLADKSPDELSLLLFASYLLEKVELLATWRRRWEPTNLRLEGAERVRDALALGHGAVLWCELSHSSSLLMKAALAGACFQAHHLSRPGHNLSRSRFGVRFLNAIVRQAEGRYVAERMIIDEGNQVTVARHILGLLRRNQLVSITVNGFGHQVPEVPVLDGVLSVATGAPHFALRSGAPLLPVFAYRDGSEYVVEVGPPIELDGGSRDAAYASAIAEFGLRLEAFVEQHPLDWSGWLRGSYSEAPTSRRLASS
jgi:lauroyl/myristoyl acyltransferase